VAGLVMEAVGLRLAVGAACTVPLPAGGKIEAEVVGFEGDKPVPDAAVRRRRRGAGTRVFPVEPAIPKPAA
jgi:flagellum-specific ATP synthase